jgi:excisionase family DNA binding protein
MTPAQPNEPRLFTVEDAASYLQSIGAAGVGVRFVRDLIASGQVARIRMGRRYYVSKNALDTWIANHERRAK